MEQPYNPNPAPNFGGGQPTGPPPKNWLVESILVTLFCCIPFGIVGIINAAAVNTKVAAGDHAGAAIASQAAGKWTKIALYCGIAQYVIAGLFMALGVGGAILSGAAGEH